MLCLAAFAVLQGHVMLSQLYIWADMMADRAPERGFIEAVESITNGDEPCALCHAIAEATEKEDPDAPPLAPTDTEQNKVSKLISDNTGPPALPSICVIGHLAVDWTAQQAIRRQQKVPTPPPQLS